MRAHEQAGPSDKRWMWMGGWAEEIWVRIKRGYGDKTRILYPLGVLTSCLLHRSVHPHPLFTINPIFNKESSEVCEQVMACYTGIRSTHK